MSTPEEKGDVYPGEYIDGYTGKPVDKLRIKDLFTPNGRVCDTCGSELIDKCAMCGAPVCCPVCCRQARKELE